MGHREDLLAGAKRCLYERGFARTTARDVVAASGTNLASIGYHFGSMEALLNAAMIEAIEDWSAALEQALSAEGVPSSGPARFEAIWARIIASFSAHRQLWAATVEALVMAERSPSIRAFLSDALQQGREGLAELFEGIDAQAEPARAQQVGSFYQAMLTGVWAQWQVEPARAPSAADLAAAIRAIRHTIGDAPDEPAG